MFDNRDMNLHVALGAALLLPFVLGASVPPPVTITLNPQFGSLERGSATITTQGANLVVDIRVTGFPHDAPMQLAHLHRGPCDRLVLAEAIGLNPLLNGRSHTVLRRADAERVSVNGAYYVSVHKMLANRSSHVACGGPIRQL